MRAPVFDLSFDKKKGERREKRRCQGMRTKYCGEH